MAEDIHQRTTMVRKPGSRRTNRKIKRELAKAREGQSPRRRRASLGEFPKRRRKHKDNDAQLEERARAGPAGEESEAPPAARALRAQMKKLRQIEELKRRKDAGESLNSEQLAKIGTEMRVLRTVVKLTS